MAQQAQIPKTLARATPLDPREARASLSSSFGSGFRDTTPKHYAVIGIEPKPFKPTIPPQLEYNQRTPRLITNRIYEFNRE